MSCDEWMNREMAALKLMYLHTTGVRYTHTVSPYTIKYQTLFHLLWWTFYILNNVSVIFGWHYTIDAFY